jgi:hypothetical protein
MANISLAALRVQGKFWRVAASHASSAAVVATGVAVSAIHDSYIGIGLSLVVGSVVLTGVSVSPAVVKGLRPENTV